MKSSSQNLQTIVKSFQRSSIQRDTTISTGNFLITEPADTTKTSTHSVKFAKNVIGSQDKNFTEISNGRIQSGRGSMLKVAMKGGFKGDQKRQSLANLSLRKEKKFDLNDYIVLEESNNDLKKMVKNYYRQVNRMLKGFGSDDLKEYLESLWDIDADKKEVKDLLPILEAFFNVIIKFYNELEEENFQLKRPAEVKDISNKAKDYLFLLQTQEAEIRSLARENQQLKISINLYQEKLKNSEMQAALLANYAQKEMENIKEEFQYAINDLKQREQDVEVLKKELQEKDSQLESFEERLVSIFILEHKIKALGAKNVKDIEKTVFEYTEKLKEMDKSSREALRKERQENENKFTDLKGKINTLTLENRKLQFENKSRIQQLNDIILEKDQYLQNKVEKLQETEEKLAIRNKEVFIITNQKDKFGNGLGLRLPTMGSSIVSKN